MKSECPVDSGDLKKSIRKQINKKEMTARVLAGNRKAYYVHMVLFGTVHHGANNFMQRSIDKNIGRLKALLGEPIRENAMPGKYVDITKIEGTTVSSGISSGFSEIDRFIRDNS